MLLSQGGTLKAAKYVSGSYEYGSDSLFDNLPGNLTKINPLDVEAEPAANSAASYSEWQSLSGIVRPNSDASVAINSDGRLEVFVVGTDNRLHHRWQTSPGSSTWSSYQPFQGLFIKENSSPAVVMNEDGRLEVFVVGANNQLYHKWQTSPSSSSSWSNYQSLTGIIKDGSNPAVIRNSDGRLEVFVVGTDNALHHKWQLN